MAHKDLWNTNKTTVWVRTNAFAI